MSRRSFRLEKSDISVKDLFKPVTLKRLVTLTLLGLASMVVATILTGIAANLLNADNTSSELTRQDLGANVWLGVATIGLLIPLLEEIVFRGLVFTKLQKKFSVAAAFVGSSLSFMLLHLDLSSARLAFVTGLHALLGGVILATLFYKTHNLLVPILSHAIFNSVSALLVLYAN